MLLYSTAFSDSSAPNSTRGTFGCILERGGGGGGGGLELIICIHHSNSKININLEMHFLSSKIIVNSQKPNIKYNDDRSKEESLYTSNTLHTNVLVKCFDRFKSVTTLHSN